MSVLVDWINEIHRWAVEVHAPAVVKDAEVCANHPLPSGEVAPKPSAPAAAVEGSQSLVPQDGHESGGHVLPAISEIPWAYTKKEIEICRLLLYAGWEGWEARSEELDEFCWSTTG